MTPNIEGDIEHLRGYATDAEPNGPDPDAVRTILARLAEVEAQLAELAEQAPAWGVEWIDPDGVDAPVVGIERTREAAERIASFFPNAHLRTAKVYRGPWTAA